MRTDLSSDKAQDLLDKSLIFMVPIYSAFHVYIPRMYIFPMIYITFFFNLLTTSMTSVSANYVQLIHHLPT